MELAGAGPQLVTYDVLLTGNAALKVTGSLEEGLPVEVRYDVEIWQHRGGWFDRLVAGEDLIWHVQMDPWTDDYVVESDDFPARIFPTGVELTEWMARQGPFEIGATPPLEEGRTYYLAVRARVTPLSEKQVGAVERWLGGGSGDRRGITGIFFGWALRFSGLGELSIDARSENFALKTAGGG